MITNKQSFYNLKIFTDFIILTACFLLAAFLAQPVEVFISKNFHFVLLPLIYIVWYFTANFVKLYNDFNNRTLVSYLFNLSKNILVQIIFVIIFLFFIKENLFTRNFVVFYSSLLTVLMSFKGILLNKLIVRNLNKKSNRRKLIIIGAGKLGINFKKLIDSNPGSGYEFVGFVDDENISNDNIIGSIEDVEKIIIENKINDVVIALNLNRSSQLDTLLNVCDKNAVQAFIIPDYFRLVSNKFQISLFENLPIITVRSNPLDEAQWRLIKRSFDLAFASFFFLFFWWLIPLIGISIKLASPGPVFFIQDRVGRKNEIFKCYKFRTMTITASNEKDSSKPTGENDSRITNIGAILRKTNLDELPQFINVLFGDMSIVGPRPHAIPFDKNYTEIVDEIKLRHRVKPGITGWAQIHGLRGDVFDFEENKKRTQKRIEHDVWYIENWSFWLDIQILFETIWQIFSGKNKGV